MENEERIRSINFDKSTEEEKILEEKKELLKPIEFDKIKEHERHYRLRKKETERSYSKEWSLPKLASHRYRPPAPNTRAAELVKREYEEKKNLSLHKKAEMVECIARRVAYGMSV